MNDERRLTRNAGAYYTLDLNKNGTRARGEHAINPALLRLVVRLATDVGRLRRRSKHDWLLDQVAASVESLDVALADSAAEIYRQRIADGVPDQRALVNALEEVDARAARIRGLLG
ncbi:MAG TPA: hypothetical protein VGU02_03950 [Gaiellaceae bacterium]|nr:hypothetical protein [Gaiellaceae bacterium]